MADNSIAYVAVYDDVDSALADLDAFDELHDDDVVGKYDAAVIDQEDGKPHIVKRVDNPRIEVLPELIGKGVKVTPVVDHEWAKSIYFKDPNGLMLEYSYITREFNDDDGVMQPRFEMSLIEESPLLDFRDR